jgi:prevent-host-death family protein
VKAVNVHEANSTLSALLAKVEQGEEVTIARNGTPVAKLVRATVGHRREPGLLCGDPAWRGFKFDPELFAPMSDADLAGEGWM